MADYANAQAVAIRLIAKKGFAVTMRGPATPTDPVTGEGGGAGSERALNAIKVKADVRTFGEDLAARATCMLICDGPVSLADRWMDGAVERPVIGVMTVDPDNQSHIISKALIGG